jgi:hypothetical protein
MENETAPRDTTTEATHHRVRIDQRSKLEQEVEELRTQVEALRQEFEEFKKQFD